MADAKGLQEGVRASINLGLSDMQVEGDNIGVIKALTNELMLPWEIDNIIQDMLKDLQRCRPEIKHCFKEANAVANFLAKEHLSLTLKKSGRKTFLQIF